MAFITVVYLFVWLCFMCFCQNEKLKLDPKVREAILASAGVTEDDLKSGSLGFKSSEELNKINHGKLHHQKVEKTISKGKESEPKVTIIENEMENQLHVGQKMESKSAETVTEVEKGKKTEKTEKQGKGSEAKKKTKPLDVSKYRLFRKEIPDGRTYGIYDGLISARYQVLINHYLKYSHEHWLFNNYDADNNNNQRTHDNTPWINDQDPLAFSETRLCKKLLAAVIDASQDDAGVYYPYRVFGKIIRRGDHTHVSADSNSDGDFSVMVFMNEFWRKNYYGELYLYDDNREIVGGATHKSARVVVWESTILRLNRPPAVQFLQGQVLFQVQFTKNKHKMMVGNKKWKMYQESRKKAYDNWHLPDYKLPNGEPFVASDPDQHKVFEYTTKTDGRKIFVFDNLFPKDVLDHLRSFVLQHGSYFYDDSIDDNSDNVQWIAGFLLKPYLKSPYWKVVKKVATYASGNPNLFPYDVSINLVRNSDFTRIHVDVSYYGEEEYTCLVYLNPNWTKNDYGETTFFEKNSDDTEIVAQVRPRYGRTVIFDGNIPHSARPPSFNFSGARLTFVTKLHRNEYAGRKKNFQEEMRHLNGLLGGLSIIDILKKKSGETFAQKQIQQLRQLKEKLSFRADKKDDDKGDEDESEDESEEVKKEFIKQQVENQDTKNEFIEPDAEHLPEESFSLYSLLDGVTEQSQDGVSKIINAHDKMRLVYKEATKKYEKKLNKML